MPKNVTDSPNQFSQSKLNISSSMVNKTKEEKFKIDIDVSKLRLYIRITQEDEVQLPKVTEGLGMCHFLVHNAL